MSRTRRYPMLLIVGLCMAATASAQSSAPDTARATFTADAADSVSAAGPRLASTASGIHRASTVGEAALLQRRGQPQNLGKPVTLMIVGGAAIVLGAVIGGDVGLLFEIGGTVSLLVGLYQYLK